MKTFNDLEFKEHKLSKKAKKIIKLNSNLKELYEDVLDSKQAVITFENGITISVLFGKCFYSNGVDTYECLNLSQSEPLGYLTKEELERYMFELQKG